MNRRSFLSSIAALPLMGWAAAKAVPEICYGGPAGGGMSDIVKDANLKIVDPPLAVTRNKHGLIPAPLEEVYYVGRRDALG